MPLWLKLLSPPFKNKAHLHTQSVGRQSSNTQNKVEGSEQATSTRQVLKLMPQLGLRNEHIYQYTHMQSHWEDSLLPYTCVTTSYLFSEVTDLGEAPVRTCAFAPEQTCEMLTRLCSQPIMIILK